MWTAQCTQVSKNGCFATQIYVPVRVCIYANVCVHCKCAMARGKPGDARGVQPCTWKGTWKWAHTRAATAREATAHLCTGQCTRQHAQKCRNTPGTRRGKCKHAWDTRMQICTCNRANIRAVTGQNPSLLYPRPCTPLLGGS